MSPDLHSLVISFVFFGVFVSALGYRVKAA